MRRKRKTGKVRFYRDRVMAFAKRHRKLIALLIFALLFPAILWSIGSRVSGFIEFGYGAVLSYAGVLLGLLGSFITYRAQRSKEATERRGKNKPRFVIDFNPEKDRPGTYTMRITNTGENPLLMVFVNGELVSARITNTYAVTISCRIDDYGGSDDEVFIEPDDEGYPRFIQICCNDPDNNIWTFDFKKMRGHDRIYYYPDDSYMI